MNDILDIRAMDGRETGKRKINSSKILCEKKGFTLAETIVAIAILTLVAAMFSNFLSVALKARNLSRERLQLVALATGKMDEIMAIPSFWQDIEGLQSWLVNDGFTVNENGTYYKKL